MSETGDPEEIRSNLDERHEASRLSASPDSPQAPTEPARGGRPRWKAVALIGGALVGVTAGAVLVTLVATRSSAVTENAIAYVNGYTDGLRVGVPESANAYMRGIRDALDAFGLADVEPDWFE